MISFHLCQGQDSRTLGLLGRRHLRTATRGRPIAAHHDLTKTQHWCADFADVGFPENQSLPPGLRVTTECAASARCGETATTTAVTLPNESEPRHVGLADIADVADVKNDLTD